jgi:hypothetical protein
VPTFEPESLGQMMKTTLPCCHCTGCLFLNVFVALIGFTKLFVLCWVPVEHSTVHSGSMCRDISAILKFNLAPVFQSKTLRSISSKNYAYLAWWCKISPVGDSNFSHFNFEFYKKN